MAKLKSNGAKKRNPSVTMRTSGPSSWRPQTDATKQNKRDKAARTIKKGRRYFQQQLKTNPKVKKLSGKEQRAKMRKVATSVKKDYGV